jgi:hypothetical protein
MFKLIESTEKISTEESNNDFILTFTESDSIQQLEKKNNFFNANYLFDFSIKESNVSVVDLFPEILIPKYKITSSSENKKDAPRENYLRENLTTKFLNLIKDEDFEFGFISRSEELVKNELSINALATRNWLNEIFVKYFDNEVVVIGILRIIARFEERIIFPQGQTLALSALSHSNNEIKELGIRAFENWCSIDSLRILKTLDMNNTWLKDYVNEVISDHQIKLCHS